jgi:hypothetical protein
MGRIMAEEETQQVTIEQAIQMYEAKIQEQTNIMFGLVAKMGGTAELSQEDFDGAQEYNTITAGEREGGGIVLTLGYEERPEAPNE